MSSWFLPRVSDHTHSHTVDLDLDLDLDLDMFLLRESLITPMINP